MEVFDKVSWQIDGGIKKENAIEHFRIMYEWLHNNGLLSADGEESYEFGIDGATSLSERDVTTAGSEFLKKYYDEYISKITYGEEESTEMLDNMLSSMQ